MSKPDSESHLHYYSYGRSDRPAVLLLHGFMGNTHDWSNTVALLQDRFYCIAVDLPGHGRSVDVPDELYPMPACAEGVIALLNNLGIDKCRLVAYSMGGRLALYLLIHYPDRFGKAVIESASPGLGTPEEREGKIATDEKLAHRIETEPLADFIKEWYRQPLFDTLQSKPELLKHLYKNRLNNDPIGLAKSLRLMGTGKQPSLWDQLDNIQSRLLLIVGGSDNKYLEINRRMAMRCQMASMSLITDAGHNVHLENRMAYSKEVRSFFANEVSDVDR